MTTSQGHHILCFHSYHSGMRLIKGRGSLIYQSYPFISLPLLTTNKSLTTTRTTNLYLKISLQHTRYFRCVNKGQKNGMKNWATPTLVLTHHSCPLASHSTVDKMFIAAWWWGAGKPTHGQTDRQAGEGTVSCWCCWSASVTRVTYLSDFSPLVTILVSHPINCYCRGKK